MIMTTVEELKNEIIHLRLEANINRICVSKAIEELKQYCLENQENDFLVSGTIYDDNPFRESKTCGIF
uniref:Guanine nucleotide-binding protein subunit gamma n=1 Tax=Tetranychus urticae TaxID=32264 RepID=T1JZU8_TETUR